jgi:hypothetical protein
MREILFVRDVYGVIYLFIFIIFCKFNGEFAHFLYGNEQKLCKKMKQNVSQSICKGSTLACKLAKAVIKTKSLKMHKSIQYINNE